MAIFAHLVVTPASEKSLHPIELIACVQELLKTGICSLPAAILVGHAQTLPYYWGDAHDCYITPNAPGFMLEIESADFPQELIWYYGEDKTAFLEALAQILSNKKSDYCISFPHEWNGWDGAALFSLREPFLLDFHGSAQPPIHRYVTHCFTLFSTIGGGCGIQDTPLRLILERYFGPRFLLEEVITG